MWWRHVVSGGIVPCILDLGSRGRWVVSFMLQLLYTWGKSPQYPLDRRLGGPQSLSWYGGEEKNSHPPPGIEPPSHDHPAHSQLLYQLSYDYKYYVSNFYRTYHRKRLHFLTSYTPYYRTWKIYIRFLISDTEILRMYMHKEIIYYSVFRLLCFLKREKVMFMRSL
jgi:hypothetical protein